MKLQMSKFKRAMVLNKDPLTFLPDLLFQITRTPRFGRRARSIMRALQMLRYGTMRGRNQITQIAEFGVARGEGFRQLVLITIHFCVYYKLPIPNFYAFDTFSGMPSTDHPADIGSWSEGDYLGDAQELENLMIKMGVNDHCQLVKGLFSDTLPTMDADFKPDLVLIDCDYYTSTRTVFDHLKDRLPTGAIIYFDDLGTNFFNPNLGEERLIHEVNRGELGSNYYLHEINEFLYYWSNAARPVNHNPKKVLDIALCQKVKLTDFY